MGALSVGKCGCRQPDELGRKMETSSTHSNVSGGREALTWIVEKTEAAEVTSPPRSVDEPSRASRTSDSPHREVLIVPSISLLTAVRAQFVAYGLSSKSVKSF